MVVDHKELAVHALALIHASLVEAMDSSVPDWAQLEAGLTVRHGMKLVVWPAQAVVQVLVSVELVAWIARHGAVATACQEFYRYLGSLHL